MIKGMSREDLDIFKNSLRKMSKERIAPLAEEIDNEGVFPWKAINILARGKAWPNNRRNQ